MNQRHKDWLEIDGSFGEGGGQVFRSSLGLSLCTGRPVRISRIRANRKKPGLMRQHLTGLRAAAQIGSAEVTGDQLRSQEVTFRPQGISPGSYTFSIGTAGSTTLVLQAILPALLIAPGPSEVVLEGGTHNPMAPPFDFLERALIPLINRMGPRVSVKLERPGFFPAGGGRLRVSISPSSSLERLELVERGKLKKVTARARVAALQPNICHRELRQARDILNLKRDSLICEELDDRLGPGNVFCVEAEAEEVTEVFSVCGQKGLRAEKVGQRASREAKRWIDAEVPVGEHLADQLIPLIALAGGGRFLTLPLSLHASTQVELVQEFLDVDVAVTPQAHPEHRLVEVWRR